MIYCGRVNFPVATLFWASLREGEFTGYSLLNGYFATNCWEPGRQVTGELSTAVPTILNVLCGGMETNKQLFP